MKNLMLTGIAFCLLFKVNAQQYAINKTEVPAATVASAISAAVSTDIETLVEGEAPYRTKSFSRTFPADRNDKVVLSNQFGSMNVKTWDKKEVKIDVSISVYSSNEKEAQRLLDGVNIAADKNGEQIACKTSIDENSWGRNRKREIKVDYVVYMPSTNSLTLSQQFGPATIGDFAGPLYAKVQYGNFNAGNLSNTNNYISVQYGNSNISEVNKAVVKQQYGSGLVIGTAGTLDLNAQYASVDITTIKGAAQIKQQYGSGLKIGSVGSLVLDAQYASVNVGTVRGDALIKQQYNSLTLGSVEKLDLKGQYASVSIGNLKGDGNLRLGYNNLRITEVGPGCRNLNVDTEYVGVNIGFADNYNADLTVKNSYSSFRYSSNVKVKENGDNDDSSSKSYSGRIGNGGTGNVRIRADYGSVTFK